MPDKFPPGPKSNPILGSMRPFNKNTLEFLMDLATYGDATSFRFGPFRIYFFNHPDYIREILVTKSKSFQKQSVVKMALGDVIGENIFTSDGDYWKRSRKLMQPAFHSNRIGAYADVMVDYTNRLIDDWQDAQPVDMHHAMTSLTMNIVTKTLFDADVTADSNEVGQAMTVIFNKVDDRLRQLLQVPSWIPTEANRSIKEATGRVNAVIIPIVQERRRTGEDHGDLLSMLLLSQDEEGNGLTDEEIGREALTIFGAGHETTANALTWTFYALSQNPDAATKLYEEVDRVLGDRPAKLDDLVDLPYTEMVVKEAMRLYPPAWGFGRDALEDVEIAGYTLPKGTPTFMSPYVLHRDARWYPHPERFDPERFTPENEAKLPKYAYVPFGGGPRVCIGNAFAMMEARLILATMVQRFSFSLASGQKVAPERFFTLRPRYGMNMVAHVRQPELTPST